MMAALTAAACGDHVHLLEHNKILGKKILSTGNGRCNLTNRLQEKSCYHSQTKGFADIVFSQFGFKDTLCFFEDRGILLTEREGYYYPRSMQASTIRNFFEDELAVQGIRVSLEQHVREILPDYNGKGNFLVKTEDTSFQADRVILAGGGLAASVLGSDGSGYQMARKLGHALIAPVPALTGMTAEPHPLKKASGVRCMAKVSLSVNGKSVACDEGELQITDYGISGIPVFQISAYAARALEEHKAVSVSIDFMPDYDLQAIEKMFDFYANREDKTILQVMNGFFNEKLSMCLLKAAMLQPFTPAIRVKDNQKSKEKLFHTIKAMKVMVTKINDFSKAQVTSGGIDLGEVNPYTMESKRVPGLYFAGEILDVDGICGGYNLQWAFSSGFVAGSMGRK